MKLKCIIVDDEPGARKLLNEYITETNFLEVAALAENPVKASELLCNKTADLMFLDINMPKMNGIEFLKSSASLPLTILTTAYTEYAIEGFELDVLDYLVKPFSYERFLKATLKAKEFMELLHSKNMSETKPDYFFVKSNGKYEKVMYDDLVYVQAMQNYVLLHTEERKLVVYNTLKGIESQLPPDTFLKIHKSTIVNLKKIKNIEGNTIQLGLAKVVISHNLHDSVIKNILKDNLIKRE